MSGLLVAVLTSLGCAILHSLWIAAVVGGLYGLLSKCLPQHLNLRYQAGGLALMIILLSGAGVFLNSLAEHWPFALEQHAAQISSTSVLLESDMTIAAAASGSTIWTMLLGTAWLLGAALSAWRLWRSHCLLRDMAKQAVNGGVLHSLAVELSAQLRLRLPVRVAISEWIDVPCVIGLLKPLILVPSALVARLPSDQMELILLHELSHVKNGDLWVNALQIVVEVLMFFHPVVYWISADLRALRERRCDRSVLEVRPTPVRYAQTLLRLEEFRQEFRGLAMAASGGELSTRVRDILMPRLNAAGVSHPSQGAALLSAMALTALVAGTMTQLVAPNTLNSEPLQARAQLQNIPSQRPAISPQKVSRPVQIAKSELPLDILNSAESSTLIDPRLSQELALEQARSALRLASNHVRQNKPIQLASLSNVDMRVLAKPQPPNNFRLGDSAVPTPKLIRKVNPVFRPGAASEYHFSMSFRVDANGLPQEIEFEKGKATASQIKAASNALSMWRFEARSSAKFGNRRLAQAFNFKEIERPCIQVIGSRICRRVAR